MKFRIDYFYIIYDTNIVLNYQQKNVGGPRVQWISAQVSYVDKALRILLLY